MSSSARGQFRNRMEAYLDEDSQVTSESLKITTALYIKCINNILVVVSGASLSLTSFCPAHACRPLARRERRYFASAEHLPKGVIVHHVHRRACILDDATQKTRLEVLRGVPRNVIHVRLDRGSGCWTAMHALFSQKGMGLEGTYLFDEPHKVWDDAKNAIMRSGLGRLLVALLMLCNLSSGPWGGSAFFRELQEMSAKYCANAQSDDPMLVFFYELLQWEGKEKVQDFGSKESLQRMLGRVSAADVMHLKGVKVKLHRWFSILDRVEQILPNWFCLAMMLSLLVLEKGGAKHMSELQALAVGHLQRPASNEEEAVMEGSGNSNLRQMKVWGFFSFKVLP